MITQIQGHFLFALQPNQKHTIKNIQQIKATNEWTWLSVTPLSSSQKHVQRLVGSPGRLKLCQFRGFPTIAYVKSLKLKMVDMDEVDGGVELQYSSLHSISNMKILTEPQLHASRFYFLLCH